jgi:hypothetical protein
VEFLIVLAILAIVVLVISAPLRRGRVGDGVERVAQDNAKGAAARGQANEVAELEAARDAKYREIRDAELDYRTGKLSNADYEAIDGELRAEAIEILRSLDRVQGRPAR